MKNYTFRKSEVEKVVKRVGVFLDRRECQNKGAGIRGANTVLSCLLDELELDLENNDLKKSSEHIYKIERLIEDKSKIGWSIDSPLIKRYKKLLQLYNKCIR